MDEPELVEYIFTRRRRDVDGFRYHTHVFGDGTLVEHFRSPDGEELWNVNMPDWPLIVDPRLSRSSANSTMLLSHIMLRFCVQ